MAKIPIIITKKPDEWALRASLGGNDDIGFYCVYRGSLLKVAAMLAAVQDKIQHLIRTGREPEVEPEDGRHTSPPNTTEDAIRIARAEFEYWQGCTAAQEDDGLSLSGMGAAANILGGLLMKLSAAEYEKRVKERESSPPSISKVQDRIKCPICGEEFGRIKCPICGEEFGAGSYHQCGVIKEGQAP
jgi:hypothetical protein